MEAKRPDGWWKSTPKIENGKVLCVAVLKNGEETTDWFSLDEIKHHISASEKQIVGSGVSCWYCGMSKGKHTRDCPESK